MSNETKTEEETEYSATGELYLRGLCNCGCGARLEDNGGLLNKDGTRRMFILYHHLNRGNAANINRVRHGKRKRKVTTENKEIRELKRAMKVLSAKIATIEIKSSIVSTTTTTPTSQKPRAPPSPQLPDAPTTTITPSIPPTDVDVDMWTLTYRQRRCVICKSYSSCTREGSTNMKWYRVTDHAGHLGYICNRCYHVKAKKAKSQSQQPPPQPQQVQEFDEVIMKNRQISELVEENRRLMVEKEGLEHQIEFNRDAGTTGPPSQLILSEDDRFKQKTLKQWDEYSIRNQTKKDKSLLF